MRTADLRHRVEIQAPVESAGATGEMVATWTTLATVWAEITPLAGREYLQAARAVAANSVRIRMRYRDDVALTVQCRLVLGPRIFEVNEIADVATAHRWWELRCTEKV